MKIINLDMPETNVTPVYQGIYSLESMKVFAYEALARPAVGTPKEMFDAARAKNKLQDLDLECFKKACANAPTQLPLFVNLLPSTIIWLVNNPRNLEKALENFPSSQDLVLEITEHEHLKGFSEIIKAVDILRIKYNVRVSLDDMANGYNRLALLVELCPDFCKLNGPLVRECNKNIEKQKLLKSFVSFNNPNCTMIAETVETKAELETIKKIGIPLAQGFVFGYAQSVKEIQVSGILQEVSKNLLLN